MSENDPNIWQASGALPKDKTVELLTALLETVKQYPEPWYHFNIKVKGIKPRLKQASLSSNNIKKEP